MMSFRHYLTVDDEDGAHGGIGTSPAKRLLRFLQRSAHELFVSLGRHCCKD
jgi:hypothetical protein